MSNPPSPNPLLKAELPPGIKPHVIGCDHGNAFLERVRKFLEGYDASKLGQAQLRLEKLDETYNVFVSHIQALELVNDSLDPLLQFDLEKEMGDFEDNFYELKAKLQTICAVQPPHHSSASSISSGIAYGALRLPSISIPDFDGDILKWVSFYDIYSSLIDSNPELSDIQKFHYLKHALVGRAAEHIANLKVSAGTYDIAMEILTDRYQNPKVLVKCHLNSLFAIPKIEAQSVDYLSSLEDSFQKDIGVLKKLGEKTDGWSTILMHMMSARLDADSKREWEREGELKKVPTYTQLVEFLKKRISQLQSAEIDSIPRNSKPSSRAVHTTTSSASCSCVVCGGNHQLFYCDKFRSFTVAERAGIVARNKLCINCMADKHNLASCKQRSCKLFGRRHNTLLHRNVPDKAKKQFNSAARKEVPSAQSSHQQSSTSGQGEQVLPSTSTSSVQTLVTSRSNRSPTRQVFLSTALVKVVGPKGKTVVARVLLDNASQPNLMTERFRRILNLRKTPVSTELYEVGAERKSVAYSVVATVCSRFNKYRSVLEFLVLQKVTTNLPTTSVETDDWGIPCHVQLADPTFATSNPTDMVIGSEVLFELLRKGRMRIDDNKPILQNSVFGWLVSGAFRGTSVSSRLVSHVTTMESLEQQVTRFWEIESCGTNSIWSLEEKLCEEIYTTTTSRDKTGRYVVELPKHSELMSQLGDSRSITVRRFYAIERRLQREPELQRQYDAFMAEYLSLGHMKLVDPVVDIPGQHYYLPHHAVVRPDSTTSKLRVVFDGSCKTTSGFALNDILLKGPTIQDTLLSQLFRFRMKPVVIKGDIEKMYRQVLVAESDQAFQRIVYRSSPTDPLQTYQLKTVTYGTKTAPYLATRCLEQLSIDEAANYPAAAPVVKSSFYVDDLLAGFDSLDEAMAATKQIIPMLASAGLSLRKWSSNRRQILEDITVEYRETQKLLELDNSAPIQALGLLWEPNLDELRFKVPEWSHDKPPTKRSVLSQTASHFDPYGLLGPVIVKAKIFIQHIWELKLAWDDPLPDELSSYWLTFVLTLPALRELHVPRFALTDNAASVQLHGFCDASLRAYGGCLYLRSTSSYGKVVIQPVAGKSRVAPLERKRPLLPRLELCGAFRSAVLQKEFLDSTGLECERTFWCDSTITLHWLSSEPSRWKPFVANRVAEIQQLTKGAIWNYISTADNPADHISRGLDAPELLRCEVWWQCPRWMIRTVNVWPASRFRWRDLRINQADLEPRQPPPVPALVANPTTQQKDWFQHAFEDYDSLFDVVRVLGFCRRFVANVNNKQLGNPKQTGYLTVAEFRSAEAALLRHVQALSFPEELRIMSREEQVPRRSPLFHLAPFLGPDKLIRVGGRLTNAEIPYDQKHPILLPKGHPVTNLVFLDAHTQTLHAGPSHLLAAVRRRYWPIDGRNKARSVIKECITCVRYRPTLAQQMMADLPSVRVNQERVFRNVGIDYCGPFHIKGRKNQPPIKCYICIFVCMATKAAHLELVTDLTTEAFIAALKRFWAKRGYPQNIYCDNATNFVGADRELQRLQRQFETQQHKSAVVDVSTRLGIQFHFIPPRSPSFGGLWKACVKSAKAVLLKVTMDLALTYEEMLTTVAQVEACLNSRPLTPLSNDPNDLAPLTPGHFIIGGPLEAIPEPDLQNIPCNRLSRWQRMQRVVQDFWSRWQKEYLPTLQKRYKWPGPQPNLSVGDMVLLQDDNLPPYKWPIARVIKTIPGADGKIRVVDVLTDENTYRRGIHRLCPLPKYPKASSGNICPNVSPHTSRATSDTLAPQSNCPASSSAPQTNCLVPSSTPQARRDSSGPALHDT